MLRLRWRYLGTRMSLNLGYPDTPENRLAAQQVATQIQLDIRANNFDPTLKRYRGEVQGINESMGELLEQFIAFKARRIDSQSLRKYRAVKNHLVRMGEGNRLLSTVSESVVWRVFDNLKQTSNDHTAKAYLVLLGGAWNWRYGSGHPNPWRSVVSEIRVAPKRPPAPFSIDEIQRILATMRSHRTWSHYHDFVAFQFCTGCRTGETIALQWQHLSHDFSVAWIGESYDGHRRKSTKTRRAREVVLVPNLQRLLRERFLKTNPNPEDLVFATPRGCYICSTNFRTHIWVPLLRAANVPYRKPYNTRHTATSHALANGGSPTDVAHQIGNSPQIIYDHYAGAIGKSSLVDFLDAIKLD